MISESPILYVKQTQNYEIIVEFSPNLISNFQIEHFKFYETSDNVLFEYKQWCLPT